MTRILREEHPRLYRPADDPLYRFNPPEDEARKRILGNILADCEEYHSQRPWKRRKRKKRRAGLVFVRAHVRSPP